MKKLFVTGSLFAFLLAGATTAIAAPMAGGAVNEALARKNLAEVQSLLKSGAGNVDDVIRALLKTTQNIMGTDPEFSGKMMALAGDYASQITPPSVPAICADLRRIAGAFAPEQTGSALYATVVQTSQSFSKAPVVVASGRPNQCEDAFLQISALAGDSALLAQMPGMRGPGLPPVTVRPGDDHTPPGPTPPTEKPSAD